MKKIFFIIFIIIINLIITFSLLYIFVFSKNIYIENGAYFSRNIEKTDARIIIGEKAEISGNINLEKGEIIFKNGSKITGDIFLGDGKIILEKNIFVKGNIKTNSIIEIGENSIIEGNISKNANLNINSTVKITGEKPKLFATTDYPNFMKYFGSLPKNHKNKFGYIYVTSHNMDIRETDLETGKYFLEIFFFENGKLKKIEKNNFGKFYENSKKFIKSIPERNIGRFGVGFVTKSGAFDKQKPDMYLSKNSLSPSLFMHEFGHILDYNFDFTDFHKPVYPYKNKENSLTEYGKFHVGEDFAEGYRFYVLESKYFRKLAEKNDEIK